MKDLWLKYIVTPIAKWWARLRGGIATPTEEPTAPSTSTPQPSTPSEETYADEINPSLLRWVYGGVDGSRACIDSPRIGALRMGRNLSYSWRAGNLAAWGLDHTQAGALACLFVERPDGVWVGGKFDWISSSRTTRDFANIYGGYQGWSLSGIANPCRAAFVIVDAQARRRTNIIAGTWNR